VKTGCGVISIKTGLFLKNKGSVWGKISDSILIKSIRGLMLTS